MSLLGITNVHLLAPAAVMVTAGLLLGALALHPLCGVQVTVMVSPGAALYLLQAMLPPVPPSMAMLKLFCAVSQLMPVQLCSAV